jgi:hypothetical protein
LINVVQTKLHVKKEKKLQKRFSEIGTLKEKLIPTDNGWTDDGQVGIRKALLPKKNLRF